MAKSMRLIAPGTTGRKPMSSRCMLTSMYPTGTRAAGSIASIAAPMASASHAPPRCNPTSTSWEPPRWRSRISWAMRVTARLTSSADITMLLTSISWPFEPHGTRL